MRSARSRWPAPILVPTSATSGAPRPKISGISRYSSRAPVPYPAIASGPDAVATNAVASAMTTLVCTEVTDATAPTPRMLRTLKAHPALESLARTEQRPKFSIYALRELIFVAPFQYWLTFPSKYRLSFYFTIRVLNIPHQVRVLSIFLLTDCLIEYVYR